MTGHKLKLRRIRFTDSRVVGLKVGRVLLAISVAQTPNSSLQDRRRWSYIGCKGAAAILDAILNHTFLPHMSTRVFFKSHLGPLQGSTVKIRRHMSARRTPISPITCLRLIVCAMYSISLSGPVRHPPFIVLFKQIESVGL